ncbi:MAG: sigma 54-interacting transcriptional regulator, partial [Bacilli bacterium]
MKIVLIAPYENLARDAEQVCRSYGERVEVLVGHMEKGVRVARKAVEEGAGVLISRGGTVLRLSKQFSVPVVEIAVTAQDVLRALRQARHLGTKFGISGFINVIGSIEDWTPLLKVSVVPIEINNDGESMQKLLMQAIEREGVDCILGDASVMEHASELGVPCVMIESGKEAIWAAIQEAKRIVAVRLAERQAQASLHTALDRAQQGLLVLEHGAVQFANRMVLELIGRDTCVGLPSATCLPERLNEFLRNKDAEQTSDVLQLSGRLWFVQRNVPSEDGRLFVTLHQVEDIELIERQVRQKRSNTGHVAQYTFDDLYGQSRAMRQVVAKAIRFAQTDSSVFIVGDTGTGKELLAQSIHNASPRANGPFVAVNIAALPDQLLESELFGYEEGAFTGARRGGKLGLFELAHGGTIFLDEIGETPLHVQQRLLRVLQERRVMRIGGEKVIPVDVRILSATNKPLWQFVENGKFRKDLFFRLDVLRLNTVPLHERSEDIPELMERLLYKLWYQRKGVGAPPRIEASVFPVLADYHWPGNVRELQNMVDYLFATTQQGWIDAEVICDWFQNKALPLTEANLAIVQLPAV